MKMYILPCLEFVQCQKDEVGEIKTGAIKTCSSVCQLFRTIAIG